MARIQASLPENGPDPFLQPTQPSSGCSRTCFRRSQVGRSKRSLEATESEEPGKRGSPTNWVLGSAWEGMGLPLRAVPGKLPCSRRALALSPPSRPPGSRLPASWWAWPAAPLPKRAERALGAYKGARAAGAQGVGLSGPGEERGGGAAGRQGAGRGGRGRRRQRQLRRDGPGRAATSAPRARGPRSPAQPCECPGAAGRAGDWSVGSSASPASSGP